ncbi:MAG: hypothetical protein J1E01_01255 [Acetatifactor sp.]|nr:hypothetical protein [Acetatifactor sp.]
MPKGLETQTGTCRFCGQSGVIHTMFGWSQEQIDEQVTLNCQCEAAQSYKKAKERREKAKKRIYELFGAGAEKPVSEEAVAIMDAAVDAIENKGMKSITVDLGHGVRGKVAKMAKESIKVEHSERKTQTYEE